MEAVGITHSSRIRMTSALFSNTSWRVMMFVCWISFRMLTSRSMSSLDTPRRLDLLRLFLINLAAYSTHVLLCRHLLTTANCPLERGRGETAEGVSGNNKDTLIHIYIYNRTVKPHFAALFQQSGIKFAYILTLAPKIWLIQIWKDYVHILEWHSSCYGNCFIGLLGDATILLNAANDYSTATPPKHRRKEKYNNNNFRLQRHLVKCCKRLRGFCLLWPWQSWGTSTHRGKTSTWGCWW